MALALSSQDHGKSLGYARKARIAMVNLVRQYRVLPKWCKLLQVLCGEIVRRRMRKVKA